VQNRPKVRTCLWFADEGLEAAEFYCSLLPDSRIEQVSRHPEGQGMAEAGKVLTVEFTLAGTPYQALNGGPHFQLDEAVSISVRTEDQAETDRLWEALLADGGSESQCGWLKDRFGLSWQIVPARAVELLSGPDGPKAFAALMQMVKIDVAGLEAACGTG
jgi:predicted 3-demethylubiquinone-9 3-methyltransferase (glyoxalase superfamily)